MENQFLLPESALPVVLTLAIICFGALNISIYLAYRGVMSKKEK